MKIIIISIIVTMLTACGGGDSNQNTDSNMTGTWRQTQINKYYDSATNEYLSTKFIETTFIFKDELGEVRYSSCLYHGINEYLAEKTDTQLKIDYGTRIFTKNIDGSYSTQEEQNLPYFDATTYYNRHFTLSKISNDVIIDKGLLILNGPISVTEYSHACLWRQYSNVSNNKTYELVVPYDDAWLSLRFDLLSDPAVGPVIYSRFTPGVSISSFNIMSPSTAFNNTIGSNMLTIDAANINIIESSEKTFSGTYSFIDINNENYSGEFQMDLND